MSKFSEGDVVRYYNHERGRWRVGIVVNPSKYESVFRDEPLPPNYVWALFVDDGEWKWPDHPTHIHPACVELHPDPGPVLASWVKEVLCR